MISIIMPVYNGEKYLRRVIDSILRQKYIDWELIAVDDGSTDNSPMILDAYRETDSRIKIIHKKNEGVSNARQDGLNASNGEYIIQCDCDDWVEPDWLHELYKTAKETDADMVWCNMVGEMENSQSIKWQVKHEEDVNSAIKGLLTQEIWGGSVFRLFRSIVCKNINVSFPKNCIAWEDTAFVVSALINCKKIACCDKYLYHYDLTNTSSITHSGRPNLLPDGYMKAIEHIEDSLQKAEILDKFIYELRGLKLFALRDFIDCYPIQDFDKFVNTYPDAISHIKEYPNYPLRLKQCAWLILHKCKFVVKPLLSYYAVLRKLGISKLY